MNESNKRLKAHEHSIELSEEQNKYGKRLLGKIEQQSLPQRQGIGVMEGHANMEHYHRGVAQAENFHTIKVQQIQHVWCCSKFWLFPLIVILHTLMKLWIIFYIYSSFPILICLVRKCRYKRQLVATVLYSQWFLS